MPATFEVALKSKPVIGTFPTFSPPQTLLRINDSDSQKSAARALGLMAPRIELFQVRPLASMFTPSIGPMIHPASKRIDFPSPYVMKKSASIDGHALLSIFYNEGGLQSDLLDLGLLIHKLIEIVVKGINELALVRKLGPKAMIVLEQSSGELRYALKNTKLGLNLVFKGWLKNVKKLGVLKKGDFEGFSAKATPLAAVWAILEVFLKFWEEYELADKNISRMNFNKIGSDILVGLTSGLFSVAMVAIVVTALPAVSVLLPIAIGLVLGATVPILFKWGAKRIHLEQLYGKAADAVGSFMVNGAYYLVHGSDNLILSKSVGWRPIGNTRQRSTLNFDPVGYNGICSPNAVSFDRTRVDGFDWLGGLPE